MTRWKKRDARIKVFQRTLGRPAPPNFTVVTAEGAPPRDSTAEVRV